MSDPILEMRGITKRFPGVTALEDVTFRVERGAIHALAGENGAGKSTLMKVLSGVHAHGEYEGQLIFDGTERQFAKVTDSEVAGITIIFQELNLIGTMTICENIFMGREIRRNGRIDWPAQYSKAKQLLETVGLDASPDDKLATLGMGKQQLVEIARALNRESKLLILDEPTASLTQVDTANLLELLRDLRRQGLTCIYISHKLDEILALADTVTILRDGRTIDTQPVGALDEEQIIVKMVGRAITQRFPVKAHAPRRDAPVLEIRGWTVENPVNPERPIVDDVSLEAYAGEVVGIAGLMGAGRTELAMSVFGALGRPASGEVLVDGRPVTIHSPKDAIRHGIAYLPEDRKQAGLVLTSDIRTNMTLASVGQLTRLGVIDNSRETHEVERLVKTIGVKTPSITQKAKNLSGGNQQKVVIGKWLLTRPRVLILDEPTRGIDVGAKSEIYQLITELTQDGVCIVMISSELPEVLGLSDRVYVMGQGRMRAELDVDATVTQEDILSYAQGRREPLVA